MTEDELTKIERRANAATPGPWIIDDNWIRSKPDETGWICQWEAYTSRADARFIAAARTDITTLIAALRAARKSSP
jgi:hypothetical protein